MQKKYIDKKNCSKWKEKKGDIEDKKKIIEKGVHVSKNLFTSQYNLKKKKRE